MNERTTPTTTRRAPASSLRGKREGAAMLVVLMVLMMSTAVATFAVHSTTMEIRSAGTARQAMQTRYVAEGGTIATAAYMDAAGCETIETSRRGTVVAANNTVYPGSPILPSSTEVFTARMSDFTSTSWLPTNGPPIEANPALGPSLGGRTANVASFEANGLDVYMSPRTVAGREMSGGSPVAYFIMDVTSRGTLGPSTDSQMGTTNYTDPRGYHESASLSRAYVEYGPCPVSGGGR